MRSNGLKAPSPLLESLKPPSVQGERTESAFFDFTKGKQTDKATRALHRMALSETGPLGPSRDSVSERIVCGQHNLSSTLWNYPQLRRDLLNRVLGYFQRRGLDGLAGWFGREFHRLLSDGIDAAPMPTVAKCSMTAFMSFFETALDSETASIN